MAYRLHPMRAGPVRSPPYTFAAGEPHTCVDLTTSHTPRTYPNAAEVFLLRKDRSARRSILRLFAKLDARRGRRERRSYNQGREI